jgi:hypothetical protein
MALNSTRGRTGQTLRAVLIMRTKIVFISGQPIKVYLLDKSHGGFPSRTAGRQRKSRHSKAIKKYPSGYLPVATSSD